ncbi:protein of unknown function [Tenacibaculum sp. 190524A02b]|uniref:hypothetical protein n=1 Tax=Tenacibaculum vairaonense TaxID=3137860 RepID=UPI0032B17A84
MNQELVKILKDHLSTPNHVLKVISATGEKLGKKGAKRRKYALTLSEIEVKYTSFENFIESLPAKGFKKDVVFVIQKVYGDAQKETYHRVKEYKIDLEMETTSIPVTHSQQIPVNNQPVNQFPSFLSGMGMPDYLGKMIEAGRAGDYKDKAEQLSEQLKDIRSENRTLREENSSLKIKLETANERKELAIEKEKLNQKGFLDSKAFESLAGMLPQVMQAMNSNANAGALGNPSLSPIQNKFFEMVTQETDQEKLGFLFYLFQNWNEELKSKIEVIIKNE